MISEYEKLMITSGTRSSMASRNKLYACSLLLLGHSSLHLNFAAIKIRFLNFFIELNCLLIEALQVFIAEWCILSCG